MNNESKVSEPYIPNDTHIHLNSLTCWQAYSTNMWLNINWLANTARTIPGTHCSLPAPTSSVEEGRETLIAPYLSSANMRIT